MKRKFLSIAFVAISTLMITAVAEDNNPQCNDKKEMCPHHKCVKGGHMKKVGFNPFEGIELTAAQQEQLDQLAAERRQNFAKMNEQGNPDNQDIAVRPNPREMQRKHLDDIKNILTPDQYVKYLENIALNRPMMHKQGHHKRGFHKQGHRHSFPGARPDGDIVPMEEPQNTPE